MPFLDVTHRLSLPVLRFLASERTLIVPDTAWPDDVASLERWTPLAWCMEWGGRRSLVAGAYWAPQGWVCFRFTAEGRVLVRADVDATMPDTPETWGTLRSRMDPARCFVVGDFGPTDLARRLIDPKAKAWDSALEGTRSYRVNARGILEQKERDAADAEERAVRSLRRWTHPEDAAQGWTKTATAAIFIGGRGRVVEPVKSGERRGFMVVHKDLAVKGWSATHEHTGLRLALTDTRDEAREVAAGVLHLADLFPSIATMTRLEDVHPDARALLRHLRRDSMLKVDPEELRESLAAVSHREATHLQLERAEAEQAATYAARSHEAALATEAHHRTPKVAKEAAQLESERAAFTAEARQYETAENWVMAHAYWNAQVLPTIQAERVRAERENEPAHVERASRLLAEAQAKVDELWPKRRAQVRENIRTGAGKRSSAPPPSPAPLPPVPPDMLTDAQLASETAQVQALERAAWAAVELERPGVRPGALLAPSAADTGATREWRHLFDRLSALEEEDMGRRMRGGMRETPTPTTSPTPPTPPTPRAEIPDTGPERNPGTPETPDALDVHVAALKLSSALVPRSPDTLHAQVVADAADELYDVLERIAAPAPLIGQAGDLANLARKWHRSTWPNSLERSPPRDLIMETARAVLDAVAAKWGDRPPAPPKTRATAQARKAKTAPPPTPPSPPPTPNKTDAAGPAVREWLEAKRADEAIAEQRKAAADALELARERVLDAVKGRKLPVTIDGVTIDEEDVPEREVEAKPAHKTGGGKRHVFKVTT